MTPELPRRLVGSCHTVFILGWGVSGKMIRKGVRFRWEVVADLGCLLKGG